MGGFATTAMLLNDVCQVRCFHGFIISTGYALRTSCETRKLRHKIVHEGLHLEPWLEKPMLRAVETMTWLFDWFYDGKSVNFTRGGNDGRYALKSTWRGYLLRFETEVRPEGVHVLRDELDSVEGSLNNDLLTEQLVASIGKEA